MIAPEAARAVQSEAPQEEKSPLVVRYEKSRELARRLEAGEDVFAETVELLDAAIPVAREGRGQAFTEYFASRALADYLANRPSHPAASDRLRYLERARDAIGFLERWSTYGSLSLELAEAYRTNGEYERALTFLRAALERLEPTDPRTPVSRQVEAQIHNVRGDWDEAFRALDAADAAVRSAMEAAEDEARAVADARRAVHRLELARIAGLRAEVFLRMGLLDQGAVWIEKEREGLEGADERYEVFRLRALIHRANLWLALDRYEDLVRELDAALVRYEDRGEYRSERVALSVRLAVALAALERRDVNRPPRAESVFREVLAQDPPANALETRSARIRLARLLLAKGRLEEAARAGEVMRGAGSVTPLEDADLAAFELELVLARLARAVKGDPAEAFARGAVASADREEFDRRLLALDGEYEAVRTDWSGVKLRKGGVGFLRYETVLGILSTLVEATMLRDAERDPDDRLRRAIETVLEAQAVSTLARRLAAPAPAVETLRASLATGEGVILFLPASDVTHVFALDADGSLHDRAEPQHAIEAKRASWVERVTRPPFGLDDAARRDRVERLRIDGEALMSAVLPASIRERVASWDSVVIAAPELIGYLPFECLPSEDGSWLGLDVAITYSPSVAVSLALDARRRDRITRDVPVAAKVARFVAAPTPSASAPVRPAIPFGDRERRRVGWDAYATFGDERVDVLEADDASFGRLLTATRTDVLAPRITHFLVHGIQDFEREHTAGLLLAPSTLPDGSRHDGLTWAGELEQLPSSGCVLLSACGTGRGPARWGDSDASNLAGVFFGQGADTVILPFAKLEYEASLRLASTFHARILAGGTPARAMLAARRALVEDPRFADPFSFGLLHVRGLPNAAPFFELEERELSVGEKRQPRGGTSATYVVVTLALVVAVALVGLIAWRLLAGRRG